MGILSSAGVTRAYSIVADQCVRSVLDLMRKRFFRSIQVGPNPDTFDPDRYLPPREEDKRHSYALATFGGGPRICLGVNFAQVEVMALAAHVRRAYTLSTVPGHEGPAQVGGVVQTLPEGIPMRVAPLLTPPT